MNNKLAQISLLINGVLVIAVGVLFWLHFSSPAGSSEEVKQDSVVVKPTLPEIRSVNGAIAYIDVDKVLDGYKYYNERKKQLEADLARDGKQLEQRELAWQKEYQAAMTAAQQGSMTQTELDIKGQDLKMRRDKLDSEIAEFEKKSADYYRTLQKDWLTKVDDYLKVLSKEKNYSYVVTYVKGDYSAIVFANDSLNITDQVLTGLNNEYSKGKK